jgi:hypothetical protein
MKKTVANRRMFRQGGAVNSGPTGILASSPSLIDAVAQDAMNVQGGPTVRMAEGGIVRKMSTGGMAARQRLIGTRTPQIIRGTGSSLTPPDLDPGAIGLLPAEQLFLETDPERTIRIFDPKLRSGQAGMDVTTPAGETTSPIGRAIYKLGQFVSPVRDLAQRVAGAADVATQKQSPSLTDDDLYFFGLLEKTQPGANQSKIIRDMIERRPDLQTEIMSLSKQAVASSPNIGRDDLMNVVAKGLDAEALDKADRAMLEGYGLDPDAMVQVPGYSRAYPQRIFTELEDEGREDEYDQKFAQDVDLGIVPSDPGQDDTLGEEDIQDREIGPEASQDEFEDPMGKERRAKAQGRRFPLPPRKPDANIAGGSQNEIEALGTPADAKDAAEQVRQTFDKPDMKPEETKRGMEYYLDQFKGAVPKYEGMSESEKGMLIAEAGLRVMAGQSPQAIENIAKGLQGVSKEFIADKKAKRAYDQQINLSAAKYALQAVRKDEERVAALAKEKRAQKQFIVKNSFTENGVKYEPGSLYIGTVGQLTTPEFASNVLPNLTTEGVYKEILDSKAKAAKLFRRVGEGKGAPTVKQLDEALAGYNTLADEARTSAKMLTMIDSSIVTNAEGKVTGLTSWASRKLDSLKNSIGMKKELTLLDSISSKKGADSKEYQYQQQVIANMMLKEILGEGSKNVSNIDRDLAQQIVGLMSDAGAITANPRLLNQRLQNVRGLVDQGLNRRLRDMKNKEFSWQNILNTAGAPASSRFGQIRQSLVEDVGRVASLDAAKQAPVLRVSDYFDFKKGTLKKKIPR